MPATVSVLYPAKEGATFDLDYYKNTHMALAQKVWGGVGLKSWTVQKYGPDAPFSHSVIMAWESTEAFGKAAALPGTAEIMDDVKNFSTEKPTVIVGEDVASG
ncbi:hypothetical protein K504DRAFT_460645 [Pleomassaria siparia CBS 279.74]|uniref:EthD domain-containing protein n=1 Tax=Pleomassaria siparia CBS 279.74 TaxID=1314801 RepID=A0A6G1JYH5_9PLEO|nr:hypothetical protein K504DRAFT_460645 [Pleomassaria siparia CBS 279.74]